MQRFDLNKNSTQNFDGDIDTNAESTSGTSSIHVFDEMIMVWYIQIGYTNENTNFNHNAGPMGMELGSLNFLVTSPGGSWTFSIKFHPCSLTITGHHHLPLQAGTLHLVKYIYGKCFSH